MTPASLPGLAGALAGGGRFKKQVEKAGVLSEMKKRQHYEKPSVMRKKKKAAARKRLMKKIRKMNMA